MKVLVVGPSDQDLFADNVHSTLLAMGHESLIAPPGGASSRSPRIRSLHGIVSAASSSYAARSERVLLRVAQRFQPDVVISVYGALRAPTVRALSEVAPAVFLWFPDAVSNLGRHEIFLANYHRLFFKNPALVRQLRDVYGIPVQYLPEAANVEWHRPIGEYGTREVIVVVGNIHPTRALLLDRLLKDGVPIEIYGSPIADWIDLPAVRAAHTGQTIYREEKSRIFRSARGVLNNLHPAEFAGSNCRLFEAAASGGVVLTEIREGMLDLFEVGREILPFGTYDGLLSEVRLLLASRDRGMAVAEAATIRAHRDHSYEIRLNKILAAVENV